METVDRKRQADCDACHGNPGGGSRPEGYKVKNQIGLAGSSTDRRPARRARTDTYRQQLARMLKWMKVFDQRSGPGSSHPAFTGIPTDNYPRIRGCFAGYIFQSESGGIYHCCSAAQAGTALSFGSVSSAIWLGTLSAEDFDYTDYQLF